MIGYEYVRWLFTYIVATSISCCLLLLVLLLLRKANNLSLEADTILVAVGTHPCARFLRLLLDSQVGSEGLQKQRVIALLWFGPAVMHGDGATLSL